MDSPRRRIASRREEKNHQNNPARARHKKAAILFSCLCCGSLSPPEPTSTASIPNPNSSQAPCWEITWFCSLFNSTYQQLPRNDNIRRKKNIYSNHVFEECASIESCTPAIFINLKTLTVRTPRIHIVNTAISTTATTVSTTTRKTKCHI